MRLRGESLTVFPLFQGGMTASGPEPADQKKRKLNSRIRTEMGTGNDMRLGPFCTSHLRSVHKVQNYVWRDRILAPSTPRIHFNRRSAVLTPIKSNLRSCAIKLCKHS